MDFHQLIPGHENEWCSSWQGTPTLMPSHQPAVQKPPMTPHVCPRDRDPDAKEAAEGSTRRGPPTHGRAWDGARQPIASADGKARQNRPN